MKACVPRLIWIIRRCLESKNGITMLSCSRNGTFEHFPAYSQLTFLTIGEKLWRSNTSRGVSTATFECAITSVGVRMWSRIVLLAANTRLNSFSKLSKQYEARGDGNEENGTETGKGGIKDDPRTLLCACKSALVLSADRRDLRPELLLVVVLAARRGLLIGILGSRRRLFSFSFSDDCFHVLLRWRFNWGDRRLQNTVLPAFFHFRVRSVAWGLQSRELRIRSFLGRELWIQSFCSNSLREDDELLQQLVSSDSV